MRSGLVTTVALAATLAFALPVSGKKKWAETTPVPVTPENIDSAIRRGADFLITDQNKNGSWGSATRTKDLNIYASIPGSHHAFQAACTAMAVEALWESGLAGSNPAVQQSIDRGEAYLFEKLERVRRADQTAIYNVWTHAYAIQCLARMSLEKADDKERQQRIKELIANQIDRLRRYESVDGGWGYYDFRYGTKRPSSSSTSFVSAAALVAFHDAEQAGFDVPQDMKDRAIASIQRQRKKNNTYVYAEPHKMRPMGSINRAGGSLGRSQACNIALRLHGDETITDVVLDEWLNRLTARNGWLDIGRKRPRPHESWFAVAGYFFYFGHYYAARCIDDLPVETDVEKALVKRQQDQLAAILLRLQEKDGSWWDFPFYDYHQPYGTAFAIISLVKCK
ncbi:MAG: hypothetical protein ACI8XO_002932 [Verrucomicrobiales bacterium]|jgi:hypothetical protein